MGVYKPILFGYNDLKSMNGKSNAREAFSEPRLVQGGSGRCVKITREWNSEQRPCRVAAPVSPR